MILGLVGLLIVVAIVLFIVKVALFGGIIGALALVLLVLSAQALAPPPLGAGGQA